MRCENCNDIIDLGLDPKETYDISKELTDHDCVMICMGCSQSHEIALHTPENDIDLYS